MWDVSFLRVTLLPLHVDGLLSKSCNILDKHLALLTNPFLLPTDSHCTPGFNFSVTSEKPSLATPPPPCSYSASLSPFSILNLSQLIIIYFFVNSVFPTSLCPRRPQETVNSRRLRIILVLFTPCL